MILSLAILIPLLAIPFSFGQQAVRRSLAALLTASVSVFLCASGVLAIWPRESALRFSGDLLVADATSRLFLALISAVFLGVALYVRHRAEESPLAARNIQSFARHALLFFSLCAAAVLANHFLLQWILLEAGALAAVPLIFHQRGREAVKGSWRYLLFSTVGLGAALLGLLFVSSGYSSAGGGEPFSFFFGAVPVAPMGESGRLWRELGLVLIIFGFGTKLGMAPLHQWLPDAYDSSPPSVTALLAAVQFNAVIVALFRVFQFLDPLHSGIVRGELLAVGMASLLISGMQIVVTRNYKRLIAYASINHAGVIAVGLALGRDTAYGVVLYVVSNALVKAVLFLTCGNIKARYHTKSIDDLSGLIRNMPVSGSFFMLGIFALLGFAPFGSFFGEIIIMKGLIGAGHFAVFGALCLITTVVFMATGRATFPMIWGDSTAEPGSRGEPLLGVLPSLFYVALLLALGVYLPEPAVALLREIAIAIGGRP